MSADRPLETGWLADTPVGDTVLRRFLFNQAAVNEKIATASSGRHDRTDAIAMADANGPVPYFNQAILLQPLASVDDPRLDHLAAFYRGAGGRMRTMLSLWPTPDLSPRGWSLVGHPAFMVRGAFPVSFDPGAGVTVRTAATSDDLHQAERVAVLGYPLDEAKGLPPGSLFPDGLLDTDVTMRLGHLDGQAVGAGACHVGHGVVNLCFAATLPQARRRGVWEALVWARVSDGPSLPAVAYTSDYSRPGFERMGFVPTIRFTLWAAAD
ncbi:MAG TPA: hypothetical protein VM282_00380 [Acidimicrobiales bacterium]|nr:hypothetical protein [Acidimicrobiales bacterium]